MMLGEGSSERGLEWMNTRGRGKGKGVSGLWWEGG
jgi:hypothetical protein